MEINYHSTEARQVELGGPSRTGRVQVELELETAKIRVRDRQTQINQKLALALSGCPTV